MNTFHGMEIISMSTSCSADIFKSYNFSDVPIPRLARVNVADIVHNRGIPLLSYEIPDKLALSVMHFKPWDYLKLLIEKQVSSHANLWHSGWFSSSVAEPRLNWGSFMLKINFANTST